MSQESTGFKKAEMIQGTWHWPQMTFYLRPNKKISVFRVTGLILGMVGTHILLSFSFFLKKNNFMHFERPFKMHKIIFISRHLKKSRFHQ